MDLYRVSVLLHLLGACVWIGGMIFLAAVVVPGLRSGVDDKTRRAILADTGDRFRAIGWVVLLLMLFTGLYNLFWRGVSLDVLLQGDGPLVVRARWKLALLLLVLVISAIHDFWLGPRAVSVDDACARERMRRVASWLGRINLLVALVMLWLGLRIVRG